MGEHRTKRLARGQGDSIERLVTLIVSHSCARSKACMESDPTNWIDEWPIEGLSVADRKRIKAVLLSAHATYLRTDFRENAWQFIEPMEQAFSGIAEVLFNADLLNDSFLAGQLRFLIVEWAVRSGWVMVPKNETLVEAFSGYWGHASAWLDFNSRFHMVFGAEVAEWRAKLLEREVERARKESVRRGPLPSATIIGASIDDWVAWDGEQYVLRPTRDSVLADDSLRLIGSARELSRPQPLSPGYVHVCFPQDMVGPTPESSTETKQAQKRRLTPSIDCPKAARRMEKHLSDKGIGLNKFALAVGTNEKTLYRFRKSGKVHRDIFEAIAKEMGTTKDDFLNS